MRKYFIELYNADCIAAMDAIRDKSIDFVFADIPYGTTNLKWDSIIDLDMMWKQIERIVKKHTPIVLHCVQPFTSVLVCSNLKMFRYEWIWRKNKASNFIRCNWEPLRKHENVVVFSKKRHTYNPVFETVDRVVKSVSGGNNFKYQTGKHVSKAKLPDRNYIFPTSDIEFKNEYGLHPTQKPVALSKYLIKTYSNEGDTVLDFCMGSGTTGVACKNLSRNFIGIEKNLEYYKIAKQRINES